MAPAAQKRDTLVERKEPWERALEVRRDGVELPSEVAALLSYPCGGGVEAVVVAGREVNDAVVEGGAAGGMVPWECKRVGDFFLGRGEGGCRCVGGSGVSG